jgi:hypothetical protein
MRILEKLGIYVWTTRGNLPAIEVQLSFFEDRNRLTFVADPFIEGGNLLEAIRQPTSLDLWIRPGAKAPEVKMTFPLDCEGRPERLVLCLRLDDPPVEGDSIPVSACE